MKPAISWEVLRRSAQRMLSQRFERGATVVGFIGPLLVCGWTIARPFNLRLSYHNLLQCLVWLAAWYTLFSMAYVVLSWLRPRQHREGEDLAHLPLPATHFLLQRAMELGLVPLRCLALSLPLWLIVLAYIGIPYGEQWSEGSWVLSGPDLDVTNDVHLLWIARIGWSTAALLAATLIPVGVGLLISETVGSPVPRLALFILPAAGLYVLTRFYDEHFRMPYRTTAGYSAGWFLLIPVLLLAVTLLGWMVAPRLRLAAVILIAFLTTWSLVAPRIDSLAIRNRIYEQYPSCRCMLYSAIWLAGHMDPPRNVRLLMDSLHSNVLLISAPLPEEPLFEYEYGGEPMSEYETGRKQWEIDVAKYEKAIKSLPRLALWFGAGLMPLLIPLAIFGGLLLGARRRGFERAEA